MEQVADKWSVARLVCRGVKEMSCRSREHDMCTAGPLAALMCSDTMSDRVDDEEARTAKLIVSERRKERRRSADAPASDARGGNDITGRDRAWMNYEATGAVIECAENTPQILQKLT